MYRRILLAALLIGSSVLFFVFGVFIGHYKTLSWARAYSIIQKSVLHHLSPSPDSATPQIAKVITSGLLNFDFVSHKVFEPKIDGGGGLAVTDEGVLIADPSGELYFYQKAAQEVHRIKLLLPDNHLAELPDRAPDGRAVKRDWLRHNDVEFIRRNGVLSLLASYTDFHPDRACFSNRLALHSLENDWSAPASNNAAGTRDGWQVVFETQPCLPFRPWGHSFAGNEAGGRIALGIDGFVYLTVGDFEFDGLGGSPNYPQDPNSDYGKTIRIDPRDWSTTKFSSGHRNPQGIAVDDQGRIWVVEQGPMGGDELNLIRQGMNYGWPYETLGVNYAEQAKDDKTWPLNSSQGRHDKYVPPVFAWLPDIAISNVKQIHDIHPRWDGDLLASSLADESLHRIRVIGDHVIYEERIPLGGRVRYVEIGRGEIYVLFDDGRFATLRPRTTPILDAEKNGTPASMPSPETSALAIAGCLECHSSAKAPRLSGIVNSPIAAQPGVDYSSALRKKNDTWTEKNLTDFLKDTQAFAPGTSMPRQFVSEADIEKIIALLKEGN